MYWENRTEQKLLALYEGELDRKTTIQKELKKLTVQYSVTDIYTV